MFRDMRLRVASGVALLALVAGCTNPDTAKRRYLESGDRFLAEKKYREAIVEYRNALEQDDKFGEARFQLASAFAELGNPEGAYQEYIRAADLMPGNDKAQVKAATLLLIAGQFEDVRSRVEPVLQRNPKNTEAQILLANALAGLTDIDGAITEVEEALKLDPQNAPAYTNLGLLRAVQGQRDAARSAFEKAVESDPKSIQARLALANFQLSIGVLPLAEASLNEALKLDPRHPLTNRALAAVYIGTDRAAMAEAPLKMVAETQGSPRAYFDLADYYVRVKRLDKATEVLTPLNRAPQTALDARTRLAQIKYMSGDVDGATAQIDKVLKSNPSHPRALMAKARWLLQEGLAVQALERATAAVSSAPRDAGAHYLLGTIQSVMGQSEEAVKSFNEVLRINPRASAAQVQLAHVRLVRGELDTAVLLAEEALRNAPRSAEARLTLARTLVATHDMSRASTEITRLLTDYPASSDVHAISGTFNLLNGDVVKARSAYERAFQLDPNAIAAITGLTFLDVRQNRLPAARERLEARVKALPNRSDFLVLAAKVYVAQNDLPKAETALRRAVDADTSSVDAFTLLGEIIRSQQKMDQARRDFDAIVAQQPSNIGARTMSAMLLHAQNNLPEAKKRYAALLELEPRAAVAANNLAMIYADEKQNLDVALQLAQSASEQLPDRADMHDTLGWVYYRKQLPQLAVAPFEQAVARQPENPTFHYHLGLAYAGSGDRARGRAAFEAALKLKPDFVEAQKELAYLQ